MSVETQAPSKPDQTATLQLADLRMRYARRMPLVLNGIDLSVDHGSIVALVGESGSGKSTLGRLVVGLAAPTSGTVLIDGAPAPLVRHRRRGRRRPAQMVFQDVYGSLNPSQTIGAQIAGAVRVTDLSCSRSEARQRVLDLLDRVGLQPASRYVDRKPDDLSGGQRQRVGIARVLASEPSVVVADEPTSMLDVSIRRQILDLLAELRDREGLAIVFITHDLLGAGYLADRVVVLFAGHVVEEGPARTVLAQPAHPYNMLLAAASPGFTPTTASVAVDRYPPTSTSATAGPSDPTACPFVTRCPFAVDRCRQEYPLLRPGPTGALVRCHRAEELSDQLTSGALAEVDQSTVPDRS